MFKFNLRGMTARPHQREFANVVFDTLQDRHIAILEAHTGMGKTLAYCYAAAHSSGSDPVFIGVPSRNLQDECAAELEGLSRHGVKASFAILKGLSNYACVKKLKQLEDVRGLPDDLERFLNDSKVILMPRSGDLSTIHEEKRPNDGFSLIAAAQRDCTREKCKDYNACYYFTNRRQAENAKVVVCNFSVLLSADLPLKKLIIDEAHGLPGVAANFLTRTVSSNRAKGHFNMLRNHAKHIAPQGKLTEFLAEVNSVEAGISNAFDELRIITNKTTWLSPDDKRLKMAVNIMNKGIKNVGELMKHISRLAENPWRSHALDMLEQTIDGVDAFCSGERNKKSCIRHRQDGGVQIIQAPESAGGYLRAKLWNNADSIVTLSGTIASTRNASWAVRFIYNLGLARPDAMTVPKETPENALIRFPFGEKWKGVTFHIIPPGFPHPVKETEQDWLSESAVYVSRLCRQKKGGLMVLVPSYRHASMFSAALAGQERKRKIITQEEGDATGFLSIQKALENDPNHVAGICVTGWEGIDLPGEILNTLVILKLPFGQPEGNEWDESNYEEAVVKFRQGVGRLVRGPSDTGEIHILDPRVNDKRHWTRFMAIGTDGWFPVDNEQVLQADWQATIGHTPVKEAV